MHIRSVLQHIGSRFALAIVVLLMGIFLLEVNHQLSLRKVDASYQLIEILTQAEHQLNEASLDVMRLYYEEYSQQSSNGTMRAGQIILRLRDVQQKINSVKAEVAALHQSDLITEVDSQIDQQLNHLIEGEDQDANGLAFFDKINLPLKALKIALVEEKIRALQLNEAQLQFASYSHCILAGVIFLLGALLGYWSLVTFKQRTLVMSQTIKSLADGNTEIEIIRWDDGREFASMAESASQLKTQINNSNEILRQSHRLAVERTQNAMTLKQEMLDRGKAEKEAVLVKKNGDQLLAIIKDVLDLENPEDIFPRFVICSRKVILLIDADTVSREYIAFLLEKENYEVVTAANYASGIYRVQQHKPDLILVDPEDLAASNPAWLDTLNSVSVTTGKTPPIIVFSQNEHAEYSQKLGDDCFLSKLTTEENILQRIQQSLTENTSRDYLG